MISTESLNTFDVEQLRHTVLALQAQLLHATALNEKLTHEMAALKRLKFAAKSEGFNAVQRSLLEETLDTDLADLEAQLKQARPSAPAPAAKLTPKRTPLPAELPRREIRHEPESSMCRCGRARAHRRSRRREARLYARSVQRRAARTRQVGMQ